jgi:hypothetical protein
VRVRDVVAEARPLAADVAVGSHGSLQRLQMHLRLIPACRDRDRKGSEWRCQGDGPMNIGQPEQHTTAASVQRNYHGCPGRFPRASDQALFPGGSVAGSTLRASPAARRRRRCRRCRRCDTYSM